MEFQAFKKIARFNREITITEKIDGTNACVAISEPGIIPDGVNPAVAIIETAAGPVSVYAGSRTRWITPGKTTDNHGFAGWVKEFAEELLPLGPGRHYGEWFGRGINRGYGLDHKRFSLFNVSRWSGADRGGAPECCSTVPILYQGEFDTDAVYNAMDYLRTYGSMAAPGFGRPEGVIVYHRAGNILLKATLENDDVPKALAEKVAA